MWPKAAATIRSFINALAERERKFDLVEDLLSKNASFTFSRPFRRNPLNKFLSWIKETHPTITNSEEEVELDARYYMALTRTFHDDDKHPALKLLAKTQPYSVNVFRAFVKLKDKKLLNLENARQFLRFVKVDSLVNFPHSIVYLNMLAEENALSQAILNLIFNK